MTEYDYSPEAQQQYLQSQSRVRHWTDDQAHQLSAPQAKSHSQYSQRQLRVDTKSGRTDKKRPALDQMYSSGDTTQLYAYSQQTTPHGSQLTVHTQTSNGLVVQQQTYHGTTRRIAPQTLDVPPIDTSPLARNPYPDTEIRLPASGTKLEPNRRKRSQSHGERTGERRSKSSHSGRRTPYTGESLTIPPVPPMPPMPQRDYSRAQSNMLPPGAAPPLQPSNGARANGIYHSPVEYNSPLKYNSPVEYNSSLKYDSPVEYNSPVEPSGYLDHTNEQFELYAAFSGKTAKSSATVQGPYVRDAKQPQRPQIEQVAAPQSAEVFYQAPHASKSSATLSSSKYSSSKYASAEGRAPMPSFPSVNAAPQWQPADAFYQVPRASKSSATLYGERGTLSSTAHLSRNKHASGKRSRPPAPEFPGEKHSSPHPAASQMMYHSLTPIAHFKQSPEPEPTRAKPQSLFKRVFHGRK